MATPKETAAGDFAFEYNGIICGGKWDDSTYGAQPTNLVFHMSWPDVDLATETVYEDSGRDAIGWDVTARIRCVIFRVSTQTDTQTHTQAAEIHKRLLEPNGTFKVAKGYGFEVGASDGRDLTSTKVDLFGVRPLRCIVKPLPGGAQGFYLEWTFRVRLHQYGELNTESEGVVVPKIKGFSHFSTYSIDAAGVHQITSRMTVHVFLGSVDRGEMTAEKAYWTHLSGVRRNIPYGFFIASINDESSPDKTSFTSTMVLRQHSGERPPFGIIDSGGSFNIETSPGDNLFTEAIATLDRSYEVTKSVTMHYAPLAFVQEMLHVHSTLVNQFAAIGNRYTVVLAKLSILRGRGRDSRFWRCQASWVLTGCVGQLIFSEKTYFTPNESTIVTTQQEQTLDNFWIGLTNNRYETQKVRENVANDDFPILQDNTATKTVAWNQSALSASQAVYAFFCNPTLVAKELSWFHYDLQLKMLTRASVESIKRMYANPVDSQVEDRDSNAAATVISVAPQPTNQSNQPIPARYLEDVSLADQLVQMSFVGIRLAHKPTVPKLISMDNIPVKAVASNDGTPKKIGNIFGCPIFLIKMTVLYKAEGSITLNKPKFVHDANEPPVPYVQDRTSCLQIAPV